MCTAQTAYKVQSERIGLFFCNSTEPIDCTNADLTADSNKKKYEKYKPKNYTPTKHEYIK